jgi:hypothetical protein
LIRIPMIRPLAMQFWIALVSGVIVLTGFSRVWSAQASEATAEVGGSVRGVRGLQTFAVAGARIKLMRISDEGGEYNAVTDSTGRYDLGLPLGTYRMTLAWMGGDCSEIHRAPFRVDPGVQLTLDFLVMQCAITDPVIMRGPEGALVKQAVAPLETTSMNVPLAEQTEKYREQTIKAEEHRWPEITVSFGKYENQVDTTRYFPLHQVVVNRPTNSPPPVPLNVPVTVTVDRYTLRASEMVLDKKLMIFRADGDVSISDGTHYNTSNSATLSFSGGLPQMEIGH